MELGGSDGIVGIAAELHLDGDELLVPGLSDEVDPLVALQARLQLPRPLPPHPGLGELRVTTRVDPALEGLLPGVALGTVARDRLELPLEALQGCETGSGFFNHGRILRQVVPHGWHISLVY